MDMVELNGREFHLSEVLQFQKQQDHYNVIQQYPGIQHPQKQFHHY